MLGEARINNMKHVLHVVNGMNRGGLETLIMAVYRRIDKEEIRFDFLVHVDKKCDYDDEIVSMGGIIYHIPSRRKGVIKNRKALIRFFREHSEYSIVHQHVSSLSYLTPLKIARRFGVPLRIVHSHNTAQSGNKLHKYMHLWNQRKLEKYATECLSCSKIAAYWLFGRKRFDRGQYTLINNGVDLDEFKFSQTGRDKARREFGINNQYVIGHVGRFTKAKNHSFLLDIFYAVRKILSNTVLILVGDGDLKKEIQEKTKQPGAESNVIFTGIRADTANLYSAMDLFLFPSLHEGLPVSLVEAQASGLPCIISDEISDEVKLRKDCISLSLTASAGEWAEACVNALGVKERSNTRFPLVESYNIKKTVAALRKIYLRSGNTLSTEKSVFHL